MATLVQIPEAVQKKLEAFERIQAQFEECFHFVQAVHGQKRFSSFSVGQVVYYLHALWRCECKDRLLSVYRNIRRYDGRRSLELLRGWQEGRNVEVVAFLLYKLDMLSFATFTAQIEEARHQRCDEALAAQLEHGRLILLNRGMNLMHALEAIFSLSESNLLEEIRPACKQYGHTPEQIEAQLIELETPLYAYRPHQLLAQRNMLLMNKLGVDVLMQAADISGEHASATQPPGEAPVPFAEQIIDGYLQMLSPWFNNLRRVRFIDRVGLENPV